MSELETAPNPLEIGRHAPSTAVNKAMHGFRWLLGVFLVIYGLGGLNLLRSKWAPFEVLAISEPLYEPVTFLLLEIATVGVGVLLLWRKRWVFVALAIHASLALWKCVRADEIQVGLTVLAMYLAANLVVLTLSIWLLRRGQLR